MRYAIELGMTQTTSSPLQAHEKKIRRSLINSAHLIAIEQGKTIEQVISQINERFIGKAR